MSDPFRRFDEIDALLARALELPEEERRAFLVEASGDDEELRDAALRLLESAARGESPIEPGLAAARLGARATELAGDEAAGTPGALAPGDRFGAYEVLSALGAGGMGEVYRARDSRLGREVALKVLPRDVAEDPERLARLEREARLLASLSHSRINTIHELEETERGKALVLELVEGPTLADRLEEGPLPVPEALRVALQIAKALEAAHGKGVLHRDLKPSNVKLDPEGNATVLDFGLAKSVGEARSAAGPADDSDPKTRTGLVLGTAPYMSPEQLRGRPIDPRSDLWALGCVLFEMLSGARAFEGESGADTAAAVLERRPDWSSLPAATPQAVRDLLKRCLEKEPGRRHADARAARLELEAASAANGATVAPRGAWLRRAAVGIAVTALVLIVGMLGYRRAAEQSPVRASAIDSIAVLPFENTSEDPDDEYLSDGLTESLINSLSKLPNLKVVPRELVFAYKGRPIDPATVAAELEVRALLTGRVRDRNGSLTVGAELVDAAALAQLWGQQFTRPRGDLIGVRDDLVERILSELRLELTAEQRQRALDPATENPEAYRLYLRTNYHMLKLTPEGLDKAVEYATQAVELDPGFALAWVALSQAHMSRGFVGLESWSDAGDHSRAATRRALDLDELLPEAWVELGYVRHHLDWDWEGAERAFARALELAPNSADALQGHSEALTSLGRLDEALADAQRAVEASPFTPNIQHWLARCYLHSRRYDEALRAARKTLELESGHAFASNTIHAALLATGREGEAVASYKEELKRAGGNLDESLSWAQMQAFAGHTAEARRLIGRLGLEAERLAELETFELSILAQTLGVLGEIDLAFEVIERMRQDRSPDLLWAHLNPWWDPLRGDPRFDHLLERMNLPRG